MARHVLLELELDQVGVARGTRRDRTAAHPDRARIAHAPAHTGCVCRSSSPGRTQVPTSQPPRGRARSTGLGNAPQSFAHTSRVSVPLLVSCIPWCSLNIRSGLWPGPTAYVCSLDTLCESVSE